MTKRFLFVVGVVAALAACDKPSEGECKKAIANIRALLGTDKMSSDTGVTAAWVRSCRGNAKKASVTCAMEASTVDQLRRCGLLKGAEIDEAMQQSAPPAPALDAAPPPPAPVDAGLAPASADGDAGGLAPAPTDAAAAIAPPGPADAAAAPATGTGTGTGAPATP